MSDFFEGKVCVVTGASTGIGLGLSKVLLSRGATVHMCSRTAENVEAAREMLKGYGDRVSCRVVDVRDSDQVNLYIKWVAEKGPIDYMFNNAGVGFEMPFSYTDRALWEKIMSVNLYGVVNGIQAVLPVMRKQGHGHIINVSSIYGFLPAAFHSIYCASKYAVLGLSLSLRNEFAPENIKFSAVCPGAVDTQIFKRAPDYSIVEDLKAPEESITIEQAGREILEGVEADADVIPITELSRACYKNIRKEPEGNEKLIKIMADITRQNLRSVGYMC